MTATTRTSCNRRAVLAGAAGGVCALALTACGSDSDDDSSAEGSGGSASSGGSGDSESSESSGSGGAAAGETVAALGDVPVGEATAVTIDGEEAMLFRPDETTVAAFSAICTHNGGTLQADGAELTCPLHASVFDAATGEVLGGPAPEPLPEITVRIEGEQIVTG